MREIRVGIVGVGNCASALVQGIEYYSGKKEDQVAAGLMHYELCGYTAQHINVVAAFDIDKRKVGKPLREAIFSAPNCTKRIGGELNNGDVMVSMGNPLDGISDHLKDYPEERRFVLADNSPADVFL
jgi:myo-inositol-1-phosphate synthase